MSSSTPQDSSDAVPHSVLGADLSASLTTEVVDDLDAHMARAGSIDRAALLPGMYLAWCARLGLLDRKFAEQHVEQILRLSYNDGSCIEMFVVSCAGTLRFEHLNERGAQFTRDYYSAYLGDWRATFGEDVYSVADRWENYNEIASVLTRKLLGTPSESSEGRTGSHRWWQFWKR